MKVIVCKDSFESILCGIYDAWEYRIKKEEVKLVIDNQYEYELFCEYIPVKYDKEKVEKVIRTVRKLSEQIYYNLYQLSLSYEKDKGTIMYKFVAKALIYKEKTMECLQDKDIYNCFRIVREIGKETHLFTGFLRFQRTSNQILFAKLKSKNNILIPLADYFSDRLPAENWIIYDEDRKYAVVHRSDGKWVVVNDDKIKHMDVKEDQYEYLWKSFVHSVSIKERENLKLQQKMLPKRYRTNMTEFL